METQKEPSGFLEKNPAGNPEETQQVTQGITQNVTQSETETEPRNNPERKLTRHQTLRQRYQEDLGGSSGGSLPCAHTHARGDAWADPPAPLATPELRDYQRVAVDGLREALRGGARLPVLQAGTGCHAPGHRVLLADGSLRQVEDVRVGELLMGPDGIGREVTALHHGLDQMFQIRPVKGDPFVVNAGHLLALRRTGTGDPVRCVVSVAEWLGWPAKRRHLWKLERHAVERFNRPMQPMAVDPHFLGVLIGDGCLVRSASVSTPDPEIIAEVHENAAALGLSVREHRHANNPAPSLFLSTPRGQPNPLLDWLGANGLRVLSGEKRIPDAYLYADRATREQLLAGLLDTDGHLTSGGYDWVTKSPELGRQVLFLARSLGLAAYGRVTEKSCQGGHRGCYLRVSISGDCSRLPLRVERKQAAPRRQVKNCLVTGFSVELVGPGEYFGFSVTGDRLYLDETFTAHHNSGKTIMAAEVIRSSQGKGKFCVFLAHRRELVHQASDKLTRFGVAHGIVMAGEQPLARHTQVASIQTLTSRWTRRGEEPPPADLVVIDECHRATARTYRQLIDWYRERGAVVLGLTATPIRTDGTGLGDVFDAMVCCPSLKSLTDDGHLVPARFYAPTNPDLTGVQVRRGDYVDGDLEGVMDRPQLVGDIVTHWLRHAADRKTVVFATSVRHSAHLAEEFRKSGVAAEHLDGETPKDERDAILRRLSDGDLQVVTNCEVLCEGWDQPDVSCLVLARPTKSPVRYLQMVGRVLRSHPGKVDALVLDHAGCVHEHGFPVEFDDWALEQGTAQHPNKTQRERQKREAKVIVCEQCFASYTGSPKCPECGHVRQVKGRDVAYIDGDLGEVKRKGSAEKVEASRGDKQRWWGELLGIAGERGYQRGWASHKYRERFGVWPRGLADVSRPPSPEVRRWVKSRQIAWAKAQQKGAAA